ncbi:DUF4390 domain-containing protein [Chitinibacter sp. FCG-7]|uniref:DUF4390 domain-containing protein n=1 Tax=Chitinibacter mangrovi TaxID=3153927 RepID=A0AAU7FA85_9NEIS
MWCWRLIGASLLLLLSSQVQAAQIKNLKSEADVIPPRIELFAKYSITLNSDLEDALKNGLTLPFVYEFKLSKPRMYAWYRQVAEGFGPNAQLTQRLSYQPLTKQYRIATGGVARHFASLEEALMALGQIKNWSVLDGSDIAAEDFAGRLRLRLDSSKLPKTYQVSTIGNTNWQLESGWSDIQLRRNGDSEAVQ